MYLYTCWRNFGKYTIEFETLDEALYRAYRNRDEVDESPESITNVETNEIIRGNELVLKAKDYARHMWEDMPGEA